MEDGIEEFWVVDYIPLPLMILAHYLMIFHSIFFRMVIIILLIESDVFGST